MIEDLLIVAAGMGTRLKAKGNLKPLIEVRGQSLIEYAIEAAFEAGLRRATVVTGYRAPLLEDYLATLARRRGWDIQTVRNNDYHMPNGLSVLAARKYMKGAFCLAMCDHMVDPILYKRLLGSRRREGEVALAVDRRLENPYVDIDDVTKVRTSGPLIRAIGKELSVYDAFDTGVFAAGPALFEALEQCGNLHGDFSISGGMAMLAQKGRAIAADVGDAFWIDVDSPQMHAMATERVASTQSLTA